MRLLALVVVLLFAPVGSAAYEVVLKSPEVVSDEDGAALSVTWPLEVVCTEQYPAAVEPGVLTFATLADRPGVTLVGGVESVDVDMDCVTTTRMAMDVRYDIVFNDSAAGETAIITTLEALLNYEPINPLAPSTEETYATAAVRQKFIPGLEIHVPDVMARGVSMITVVNTGNSMQRVETTAESGYVLLEEAVVLSQGQEAEIAVQFVRDAPLELHVMSIKGPGANMETYSADVRVEDDGHPWFMISMLSIVGITLVALGVLRYRRKGDA